MTHPLERGAYGCLIADPPWNFLLRSETTGAGKSPQAHYPCMDLAWIQALPVAELAAPDSLLLLWATAPMLPQALATLEAWRFRYVTAGAWHKRSRTGRRTAFGTGYVLRSACEPFLLGRRGTPRYGSRSERNLIETLEAGNEELVIEAPLREHSRKPDAQYALMERLVPGVRRAELFANPPWAAGWDRWAPQAHRGPHRGAHRR